MENCTWFGLAQNWNVVSIKDQSISINKNV